MEISERFVVHDKSGQTIVRYSPYVYTPYNKSDISAEIIPGWVLFIIIFIIVVLIIIREFLNFDQLANSKCRQSISKHKDVCEMIKSNNQVPYWSQLLLISFIVPIPAIYFLKGRMPSILEFFIVFLIVLIVTGGVLSWRRVHYTEPNTKLILAQIKILNKIKK